MRDLCGVKKQNRLMAVLLFYHDSVMGFLGLSFAVLMTVGTPFSFRAITLSFVLDTNISEKQFEQKYFLLPILPRYLYPHCGHLFIFLSPDLFYA